MTQSVDGRASILKTLWKIISKVLFWDYERGSVPYDLMVIGVVAFVFLTPRAWFKDRPSVMGELHGAQVRVISENAAAGTKTFRIDAKLLPPVNQGPQWESRAHDLIERNMQELREKKFSIVSFEAHQAPDGAVLYYDVVVR